MNDSIIYYASNTSSTNGIIYSPKKYDYSSNLFIRVISNFIQSCFKIRNLFELTKLNNLVEFDQKRNETLIEQGVLFNILIPDEHTNPLNPTGEKLDSKNTATIGSFTPPCAHKTKELNFWVVGRRRFKRCDSNSEWSQQGDVFLCFHDAAEQILLELAFDIGFSKKTIKFTISFSFLRNNYNFYFM